jgi:membrane protease YdiL (CAAX protease family)
VSSLVRGRVSIAILLVWSVLPSIAIWIGLYVLKSPAWAYGIYLVAFLLPAIIVGRRLWLPTWKAPALRDLLITAGAGIAFSLATVAAYEIAGNLVLSDDTVIALLREQGLSASGLLIFGVYAVLINPIFEELYWRGVLFNALTALDLKWKWFALCWSSVTYALFHFLILHLVVHPVWSELGVVALAAYGAVMALIYRRTGSIITTAVAHGLLTDLACIALLIDFYRKYPGL